MTSEFRDPGTDEYGEFKEWMEGWRGDEDITLATEPLYNAMRKIQDIVDDTAGNLRLPESAEEHFNYVCMKRMWDLLMNIQFEWANEERTALLVRASSGEYADWIEVIQTRRLQLSELPNPFGEDRTERGLKWKDLPRAWEGQKPPQFAPVDNPTKK